MPTPPSQQEIREASGISQTYASLIERGKQRPSRSLAIHLYRKTGWRHESIAELTEDQMAVFEQVEPWIAPADRAA